MENSEETKENKKSFLSRYAKYIPGIWDFVKVIIIASLIVFPIRYFLFQPFIVNGESMSPNFHTGDYLIIDEISYRVSEPKRGDVVVLEYPLDKSQKFIKRIIGLPGETIEIKEGKISISKNENGEVITLNENNYLSDELKTDNNINITLKENSYFVLGDNRQFSFDSRRWGQLPEENIIGKAFLRLFPIGDISFINSPDYK